MCQAQLALAESHVYHGEVFKGLIGEGKVRSVKKSAAEWQLATGFSLSAHV